MDLAKNQREISQMGFSFHSFAKLSHVWRVLPVFRYFPELMRAHHLTEAALRRSPIIEGSKNPLTKMRRKKFLLAGFGIMPYEMAVGNPKSSPRRVMIGSISARVGILMAMVDDVLDNSARTVDRRKTFLTNVYHDLLEGTAHHSIDSDEEISYWIAQRLFQDFFVRDTDQRAKPVFWECVMWLNDQHTEYDPDRLLIIEQGVGGSSCETIPILTEIEMDSSFPVVREAARFLGSAGQLLDDWADIDADLRDQVNTFATRSILVEGDTPEVRSAIKERYFALADILIQKGHAVLESNAQKRVYRLMSAIVDARYR